MSPALLLHDRLVDAPGTSMYGIVPTGEYPAALGMTPSPFNTQTNHPLIHTNQGVVKWMAHRPSLPQGNLAVPSALECFTTRFGMGRGGSTPLHARQWFRVGYE